MSARRGARRGGQPLPRLMARSARLGSPTHGSALVRRPSSEWYPVGLLSAAVMRPSSTRTRTPSTRTMTGAIHPHALLTDDDAVDTHAPGGDQPGTAPGGHPGRGEDLLRLRDQNTAG